MSLLLTTLNCKITDKEPFVCLNCGRKFRKQASVAICPSKKSLLSAEVVRVPAPKHRPRTVEELELAILTCSTCDEYIDELCVQRTNGCGACRNASAFSRWRKSGAPCPIGKFPGTDMV